MKPALLPLVASVVLLVAGAASSAHDELGDPRAKEIVAASANVLSESAASGAMSRDALLRLDMAAEGLATTDFDHLLDAKQLENLDSRGKAQVVKSLEALKFLRATRTNVADAPTLSLLLASDDPMEVASAISALLTEPFGKGYRQTVVLLSRDKRPEVRLAAGILAKYGFVLEGTDPGLRAVAENLLVDEDPRVASVFARGHCMDFEDVDLLDRMVARLDDNRPTPERANPGEETFLNAGGKSVSAAVREGLCAGLSRKTTFLASVAGPPGGETATVSEFREWWKGLREALPAKPAGSDHSLVYSGLVTLKAGEMTRLDGCRTPLEVRLVELRLLPDAWAPRISMSLELHDQGNYRGLSASIGNPRQRFGWIAGAGNNTYSIRALAAPLPGGKARVRLWIWESKK